jgi:hypothetical protein
MLGSRRAIPSASSRRGFRRTVKEALKGSRKYSEQIVSERDEGLMVR